MTVDAGKAKGVLTAPLGVLLGAAGILSQEQQDASGEAQAQMIALRNAVENGDLNFADPKATIGGLSRQSATERQDFLERCGITDEQLQEARDIVTKAKETRGNVNDGYLYAVSPIGFIHMDLHARSIDNFKDIKEAALIAQRAIDASDSANRILDGKADATLSSKRGFKLFGDETPELKAAVETAQRLHKAEEAGATVYQWDVQYIADLLQHAAEKFEQAGYPQLAEMVKAVEAAEISPALSKAPVGDLPNHPAGQTYPNWFPGGPQ